MSLTEHQRHQIMRRLAAGERRKALAAEFAVSYGVLLKLDHRRTRRTHPVFRGLPTPAMKAWIKAERWEQVRVVNVAARAIDEAAKPR